MRVQQVKAIVVVLATVAGLAELVQAQTIALDHSRRCGPLICFPSVSDPTVYHYLPSEPHLAKRPDGTPEFSFMRYVEPRATGGGEGGVTEAEGGGIVHFLVDYSVADKELAAARQALRKEDEKAVLKGPVLFEQGRFALVSTFAPEDKDNTGSNVLAHRVVGIGRAPLIEGLKSAVSMHLTKQGAQILWNSFQTATPDVSLLFEMTFSGLRNPAEATITADWDKLQKQTNLDVGGKFGYGPISVGFDFHAFWERVRQSGAVAIDYRGDPSKLQAIIDRAYARLQELVFEPIPPESQPVERRESALDELVSAIRDGISGASGKQTRALLFGLSLSGGYKLRRTERSGSYRLDFRQRLQEKLTTAMAGNIGSLYQRYGKDPRVFRTVNLADDVYRRREIAVSLDARDSEEFNRYINHVTVTLAKKHGSGSESTAEAVINRRNFSQGKPLLLTYPWDAEASHADWRRYRYKVAWLFIGGGQFVQDWREASEPAISLVPPYEYRKIEFVADPNTLKRRQVRAATVRSWHSFFGKEVHETINLIPAQDLFSVVREFAVPPGNRSIEYEITWTLNDGRKLNSGRRKSDDTIIFCDELPG